MTLPSNVGMPRKQGISTSDVVRCPWIDPRSNKRDCPMCYKRSSSLRDHLAVVHSVFLTGNSLELYHEPPPAELAEKISTIRARQKHNHKQKIGKKDVAISIDSKPVEATASKKSAVKNVVLGRQTMKRLTSPGCSQPFSDTARKFSESDLLATALSETLSDIIASEERLRLTCEGKRPLSDVEPSSPDCRNDGGKKKTTSTRLARLNLKATSILRQKFWT